MIRKNYIRSLLVVGGSVMVTVPPAFVRRKKLAHGIKIVVQDCVDYLLVKCLDEKTIQEIQLDNKQHYNLSERKRLKIISKTYRQKQIDQQSKGSVKWLSKKKVK